MNWYRKSVQEVLNELEVKLETGLAVGEASSRLKTYGPNLLAQAKRQTLVDIFLRQFKSPLI